MRALLLATTFGAAQSMAVTTKTQSKKPAVQALLESATTMLKNGATPEVVTFAQYTLEEVTGTVMPAIISESQNDQSFINNLHGRFAVITNELVQGGSQINQLNAEELTLGGDLATCRQQEHDDCYGQPGFVVPAVDDAEQGCARQATDAQGRTREHADLDEQGRMRWQTGHLYGEGKRPCERDLYNRWTAWVEAETNLRTVHDSLDRHICPEGTNGTTHEFRVTASEYMHDYMTKKEIADNRLNEYDLKVPCCEVTHGILNEKSHECNLIQTNLEEKACEHASAIVQVLRTYYRDYAQSVSAYRCAEEEVRQLETDRKKEWVTLTVVRCLLDRIEEQNGRPCDESTGGVAAAVATCEELHATNVCEVADDHTDSDDWSADDVRSLCINYPEVPEHPPLCTDRDSVTGGCRPQPSPVPCADGWTHSSLSHPTPGFPVAPFSYTNIGCNAYPAPTCCNPGPTPQPYEIDTCPGWTADGCSDRPADDHELTYVRSVDGVADVRCCDNTGSELTCESQNFDPVNGLTPSANGGCYFGVTYQNALAICHAEGMRICTVAEMTEGSCCDTGCGHDNHAIWVDAQGLGADRGEYQSQTHDQHQRDVHHRDGRLRDNNGDRHETYQANRCQPGMPGWPDCLDQNAVAAESSEDWRDASADDHPAEDWRDATAPTQED